MADIKIFTDMIEDKAKDQIEKIAAHPAFQDAKIRIMPDVHAGKGCVCGFTADLGEKVVPSLIGVDIGCGMYTVCLGKIDIDFAKLDKVIRRLIPSGKTIHQKPVAEYDFVWKDADPRGCIMPLSDKELDYVDRSVGSLGGGNHFVEIDVDKDGVKYLIIHTGSRKFGKMVCDYWQDRAVDSIPSVELTDADLDEIFK